jgi:hypothetical protein
VEDGALLVNLQPIIPLHIIRAIGTVRYLQAIGELCGPRWVIHDNVTDKVTTGILLHETVHQQLNLP